MTSKYIIFQDGELKGYLNDEGSAKQAVSNLSKQLTEELSQTPVSRPCRVFTENLPMGVKIYTQLTGAIFDGSVVLKHTIEYKPIELIVVSNK